MFRIDIATITTTIVTIGTIVTIANIEASLIKKSLPIFKC